MGALNTAIFYRSLPIEGDEKLGHNWKMKGNWGKGVCVFAFSSFFCDERLEHLEKPR